MQFVHRHRYEPDGNVDRPHLMLAFIFYSICFAALGIPGGWILAVNGMGGSLLNIFILLIAMLFWCHALKMTHCRHRLAASLLSLCLCMVFTVISWITTVQLVDRVSDHPFVIPGNKVLERYYDSQYEQDVQPDSDVPWYWNQKTQYRITRRHHEALIWLQLGVFIQAIVTLVLSGYGGLDTASEIHDAKQNRWASRVTFYFPEHAGKRIAEFYEQGKLEQLVNLPFKQSPDWFRKTPYQEVIIEAARQDDGSPPDAAYITIGTSGEVKKTVKRMSLLPHEIKALATIIPKWRVMQMPAGEDRHERESIGLEYVVRAIPLSRAMSQKQTAIIAETIDGVETRVMRFNHLLECLRKWAFVGGWMLVIEVYVVMMFVIFPIIRMNTSVANGCAIGMLILLAGFLSYLYVRNRIGDAFGIGMVHHRIVDVLKRRAGVWLDLSDAKVIYVQRVDLDDVKRHATDFALLKLDEQSRALIFEGITHRYRIDFAAIRQIESGSVLTSQFLQPSYPSLGIWVGDVNHQMIFKLVAYRPTRVLGWTFYKLDVPYLRHRIEQWHDECHLYTLQQERESRYTDQP